MNEWQPIETAPKSFSDVVYVLIATIGSHNSIEKGFWDAYYAHGGKGYEGGNGWVIDALGYEYCSYHPDGPTHWMPLPDAPK